MLGKALEMQSCFRIQTTSLLERFRHRGRRIVHRFLQRLNPIWHIWKSRPWGGCLVLVPAGGLPSPKGRIEIYRSSPAKHVPCEFRHSFCTCGVLGGNSYRSLQQRSLELRSDGFVAKALFLSPGLPRKRFSCFQSCRFLVRKVAAHVCCSFFRSHYF